MTVEATRHGDIEIAYETSGPPTGEPLLLVMGTGGSMLAWHPDFCQALVDSGFQVARYDNRDSGRSTHFTEAGTPNQLKMWLRPASAAVYRLEDMAGDAIAVLDANGWESAHVVGVSQGGMIAQVMATEYPDEVRSLTSISSAPAPRIGQPRIRTLLRVARVMKRRVTSLEQHIEQQIEFQKIVGSPGYLADTERVRETADELYRRGIDLAAIQRHTAAIAASGDRRRTLSRITAPTLVIHGDADPLIRPIAGRETADAIPGARLVTYPGMGHDLPCELWPSIVGNIRDLAQSVAVESNPT